MRDLNVTTNHMQYKCSDCLDKKARPFLKEQDASHPSPPACHPYSGHFLSSALKSPGLWPQGMLSVNFLNTGTKEYRNDCYWVNLSTLPTL